VQSSDKIVVDDWEQVKHRGTQILCKMLRVGLLKENDIHANLGEIVIGKKKGRENDKERIFFCPIGMSIEDIAASAKIYKKALEKNLGQRLILWISPEFE
jgi:ornithine cyclodeaminase